MNRTPINTMPIVSLGLGFAKECQGLPQGVCPTSRKLPRNIFRSRARCLKEKVVVLVKFFSYTDFVKMNPLIKTTQRVADYGEVLTPPHIVKAMLDLVAQEADRIDSRFLEPACGTGNFLIEVLQRKLRVVEKRYRRSQLDYERYAVVAVSSLYGIDILEDNAEECRQCLYETFDAAYTALYGDKTKTACRESVRYLLKRNIVHGDALSLQTVGENPQPIVFGEWSLVNGSLLKRRDFAFHEMVQQASMRELPLFSDLGEEVFIPEPVKEYPPVHFLELAHAFADEL